MLRLRQTSATPDESLRQELMWSVICDSFKFDTPNSLSPKESILVKMTQAVYGHRKINPLTHLKIYKSLDEVLQLLPKNTEYSTEELLNEHAKRQVIKDKIAHILKSTDVEVNDIIHLPVRTPVLAYCPESPFRYDFKLPIRASTCVSLLDFELLAFDNNVLYQYYESVTFSNYFYHNATFMLGISDTAQLEDDNRWQSKLVLLIKMTDFVDVVTTAAFYEDRVQYKGVTYDSSFVPKYDVHSLIPSSRMSCDTSMSRTQPLPLDRCTEFECLSHQKNCEHFGLDDIETVDNILTYRSTLDVRRTDRVPAKYMSLFRTFPFKDGHYVRPDGTLLFVNVDYVQRKSTALTIEGIHVMDNLEAHLVDASRSLHLQDVLVYALYAEQLKHQGVALLVLRQMIGDCIKLEDVKIRLPYVNEVLEWVPQHSTSDRPGLNILLPKRGDESRQNILSVDVSVALIRDIATLVQSKLSATFVCSLFHLMECDYSDVYERLNTDTELYVFLTFIIQQYNTTSYRSRRESLNPKFGSVCSDTKNCELQCVDPVKFLVSKYRVFSRQYTESTIQQKIESFTIPLITPTDVSETTRPLYNPNTFTDLYEFANKQLNELAKTGSVNMTTTQIAAYITLCIS